jgi:hypothetical protein
MKTMSQTPAPFRPTFATAALGAVASLTALGNLLSHPQAAEPPPFQLAATTATVRYQQGVPVTLDGIAIAPVYAGTQDAQIRSGLLGGSNYGGTASVNIDGEAGALNDQLHGLIRFDNIVGTAPGQIPPGSVVQSAILDLWVFDAGHPLNLLRIDGAWQESSVTWANFTLNGNSQGGIQADGIEATLLRTVTGTNGSPVSIDITDAVQSWVSGTPNNGLGFTPTGSNGVDWRSSEYENNAQHPRLTVEYKAIPEPSVALLLLAGTLTLLRRQTRCVSGVSGVASASHIPN